MRRDIHPWIINWTIHWPRHWTLHPALNWVLGLVLLAFASALLAEAPEKSQVEHIEEHGGVLEEAGGLKNDRKTLTISAGDWPPFFVEDEPGQGSVARLVRDVFAEQGYDVTFHFLPWKRAYREAAIGRYDATAIWMYAKDREKDFRYSDAVMREQFVLFHRRNSELQWQTLLDLSGLTLGASIGYSYGPEFDQLASDDVLKVEQAASPELNFRKLLYGRIDAFPEEINVGYYILRRETDNSDTLQITHHPQPILENESYLLFPRNDPETEEYLHVFNRGLKEFRENGRYNNYFGLQNQASLKDHRKTAAAK